MPYSQEASEYSSISSPAGISFQAVFLLIIEFGGILLNLTVIFVICKRHKQLEPQTRYILLGNIVFCDLLLLLWVMPVTSRVLTCNSSECSVLRYQPMCSITAFVFQVAYIDGIATQVLLALDRAVRAVHPFLCVVYMSKKCYTLIVMLTLLFSMINAAIPFMPSDSGLIYVYDDQLKMCSQPYRENCWYSLYISILNLLILAPIVPGSYVYIAVSIYKMSLRLQDFTNSRLTLNGTGDSSWSGKRVQSEFAVDQQTGGKTSHECVELPKPAGPCAGLTPSREEEDFLVVPLLRCPHHSCHNAVDGVDLFPLNVPMVYSTAMNRGSNRFILAMSHPGLSPKHGTTQGPGRMSCPLPRSDQNNQTPASQELSNLNFLPGSGRDEAAECKSDAGDISIAGISHTAISNLNYVPSAISCAPLFKERIKQKYIVCSITSEQQSETTCTSTHSGMVHGKRKSPCRSITSCLLISKKSCDIFHPSPEDTTNLLNTAIRISLVRGFVLGISLYMCALPYAIFSRCPRGDDISPAATLAANCLLYSTSVVHPLLYFFWHDSFVHQFKISCNPL